MTMKMEIDGIASGDRALAAMTEGELRLGAAAEEAIEKVMAASPQARCVKVIEWAAGYLDASANDDQRIAVASQIVGFARTAADFLERGDFRGLESSLSAFENRVNSAAQITPAQPMPLPDLATYRHFGWKASEASCLRDVLFVPMLGARRGDTISAIDEESVTLSSGLRLTKSAIIAACQPAHLVGR